ncbi:MAG: ribulose-phosphate 3-epimerase [Candidatus Wildermuthbacteria bacterium]|nr:ribulose-phosphate 3-epimerase [Candidatus Wildermuthbacteria bacterium]
MQKIIPAILTLDSSALQKRLAVLRGKSKWVQIDIMDGTFVPNTSVGISELGEAFEEFNLEIHLMVLHPERYLEDCFSIGAKRVYVHAESAKELAEILLLMKKYPFDRGVAINPETPISGILKVANDVDALLVLGVVPGAQGHAFIPSTIQKIREARNAFPDMTIGVDGGVSEANVRDVFGAGVDYAVVGSGIWENEDPIAAFKKLEEMVK